jgi:hypothetical protein
MVAFAVSGAQFVPAGVESPVARWAHNPKGHRSDRRHGSHRGHRFRFAPRLIASRQLTVSCGYASSPRHSIRGTHRSRCLPPDPCRRSHPVSATSKVTSEGGLCCIWCAIRLSGVVASWPRQWPCAVPFMGPPCCDPDRAGQADGFASTRLLIASGGGHAKWLRKCRVPRDAIPGWRFPGPPVALGPGLDREGPEQQFQKEKAV